MLSKKCKNFLFLAKSTTKTEISFFREVIMINDFLIVLFSVGILVCIVYLFGQIKKVLCEKREMPHVKKHSYTVEEENVFAFVEQEEN